MRNDLTAALLEGIEGLSRPCPSLPPSLGGRGTEEEEFSPPSRVARGRVRVGASMPETPRRHWAVSGHRLVAACACRPNIGAASRASVIPNCQRTLRNVNNLLPDRFQQRAVKNSLFAFVAFNRCPFRHRDTFFRDKHGLSMLMHIVHEAKAMGFKFSGGNDFHGRPSITMVKLYECFCRSQGAERFRRRSDDAMISVRKDPLQGDDR